MSWSKDGDNQDVSLEARVEKRQIKKKKEEEHFNSFNSFILAGYDIYHNSNY